MRTGQTAENGAAEGHEDILLRQGDCLQLMQEIPAGSVDMVLCDPPYGITSFDWDRALPAEALWAQLRRVLKPNGVAALFGTEPNASRMKAAALDLYKYDWIWMKRKPSAFVQAKNMPMRRYELISVFSGGSIGHRNLLGERRMPYSPQGVKPCGGTAHSGSREKPGVWKPRPSHRETYVREYTGYPDGILTFPKEPGAPAVQKPAALLEYLILTYTEPGETVLDCCMGSGSTGTACIRTGRRFIGMELDPERFREAAERLGQSREGGGADGS